MASPSKPKKVKKKSENPLLAHLMKMTEMARHAPMVGHPFDGLNIEEAEDAIRKAGGKVTW